MKTVWTKNLKDQEAQDKFKDGLAHWLTHDPYVKRLNELLDEDMTQTFAELMMCKQDETERKIGKLKALAELKDLMTFKMKESK